MKIIRRRRGRHRAVAFTVSDCVPWCWNIALQECLLESNPAIGSDSGGESVPDSGPVQELGPVRIEFRLGRDSGIGLGPELGPVRLLRFSFRPQLPSGPYTDDDCEMSEVTSEGM